MPEPTQTSPAKLVELVESAERAADVVTAARASARRLPDSFTGYEITREIHRGGQGVVYQAIQKTTKRKVAIKVLREGPFAGPRDKARFEREAHILGHLKHPRIVAIHDCGEMAGCFYYVMDYIPGQPLDVYIASDGRSIDDTLRLFGKICEAVSAAHLRGVIHRDLKPGNIQIDADGEPHLLDFGLAKIAAGEVSDDSRPQVMTMSGQFIGSLPWASPEQAAGNPEQIDIRTDVYSLGVVLYQMLTSKFPYGVVGNMRDVLDNILKAEPTRPSTIRRQINDEVETIVLKCLRKERERRYQSAVELARDIEHYLAGEPIEAKRDSALYVLRKKLRRHRSKTLCGLAIAALFAGLGIYAYERHVAQKADELVDEGLQLEQREQWNQAFTKYLEAVDYAPGNYRALFYAARWQILDYGKREYSFRDRASLEEARRLCDEALILKPDAHQLWNLKAGAHYFLGELDAAEAACRQALHLKPDYFYASSNLAKVLALQHRFDEALAAVEEGIPSAARKPEKGPFDDGIWLTLGTLQFHLRQDEAVVSLQRAREIDSKESRNWVMLARLHLTLPGHIDFEKALDAAKIANGLMKARDPRISRILALAFLRNDAFKDAVTYAEAAIDGGDLPAYGHLIRAIADAHIGNQAAAKEQIKMATENWPKGFESDDVIVSAEKEFLWLDTLAELQNLCDEAEGLIEAAPRPSANEED